LPHDDLGEVDLSAYQKMLDAMQTGRTADFDNVPLGAPDATKQRRLINPQAGHAFDLVGADSHHLAQKPAPTFAGAEQAGEMVENYWMALTETCRHELRHRSLTIRAAKDLSKLSDFRGPKVNGAVTGATLFRGFTAGDLVGPYLSQFLLKTALFGARWSSSESRPHSPALTSWSPTTTGSMCREEPGARTRHSILCGVTFATAATAGQYVHIDVLFPGLLRRLPDPFQGSERGWNGRSSEPGQSVSGIAHPGGFRAVR